MENIWSNLIISSDIIYFYKSLQSHRSSWNKNSHKILKNVNKKHNEAMHPLIKY